jgi:membrane protease YdiL (CAAX protease family)
MVVLEHEPTITRPLTSRRNIWFAFCVLALLLLALVDLQVWAAIVMVAAAALAAVPRLRPSPSHAVDRMDLLVVGGLYLGVVVAFRVAFTVFTTDNVLGLFLSFATGLLLGVVGPVVYQVWVRGRDLRSLGIGAHQWRATLAMGLVLAAVQFAVTLVGYQMPDAEQWVPLLGMSLVVGLFEAIFFRGFIQGRLEASVGPVPAVIGAAVLYAAYHVGYGMGPSEMWFLLGLGVLYAITYRLTTNILILWPLLTPLGAFFNNLDSGDIELPWASLLGFADVAMVMLAVLWLACRRIRRREPHLRTER